MAIKNFPNPDWVTVAIHGDGTPNRVLQMRVQTMTRDGFKTETLYIPSIRGTEVQVHNRSTGHDIVAFFYDNGDFIEHFEATPPYIELPNVANVAFQTMPDPDHGNYVSLTVVFKKGANTHNFTIYARNIIRDYRFDSMYALSNRQNFQRAYKEEVEKFAPHE